MCQQLKRIKADWGSDWKMKRTLQFSASCIPMESYASPDFLKLLVSSSSCPATFFLVFCFA